MARLARVFALSALGWLIRVPGASAQMPPPSPPEPGHPGSDNDAAGAGVAGAPAPPSPPAPVPAPPLAPAPVPQPSPVPESPPGEVRAGVPMVDAEIQEAHPARYGIGIRTRWTSVPKWVLGTFLDQSVPLSSYSVGIEGFRRTGNFDFVLGFSWQSLSPSDGNWLGRNDSPSTETDFVQFKGVGALSVDAAFILHTDFTESFGIHYGGGVGIGIVTGRLLRTSDGSAGCATNPGSAVDCHPVVCATGPCTEDQLKATEGGIDTPTTPSRFEETRVPTVYPIVDLVTGLDFRLPARPDVAFKIDLGYFFPYFFVGGGVTYRI